MNMIGLNSQFQNAPTFFRAFLLDQFAAIRCDRAGQNRFAPLRNPDELIDDQVDAVLVARVIWSGLGQCVICHVVIVHKHPRVNPSFAYRRAKALARNPPIPSR